MGLDLTVVFLGFIGFDVYQSLILGRIDSRRSQTTFELPNDGPRRIGAHSSKPLVLLLSRKRAPVVSAASGLVPHNRSWGYHQTLTYPQTTF